MCLPPLMLIVCPVMQPFLARLTAVDATSSGWPKRPMRIWAGLIAGLFLIRLDQSRRNDAGDDAFLGQHGGIVVNTDTPPIWPAIDDM